MIGMVTRVKSILKGCCIMFKVQLKLLINVLADVNIVNIQSILTSKYCY